MSKEDVKISIITVGLNNKQGLHSTIKSVAKQTYKVEYIVIDGGSVDGSVEIIQENRGVITYWVSEKDSGIYNAMNKGLKYATGKYCMFLNSGDELCGVDIIERCVSIIEKKQEVDVFYGDIFMGNSSRKFEDKVLKKMPEILDIIFFRNATINHQSSLIKRSLFDRFGLYPEEYKVASDYWLYLISLINGRTFFHVNFPLIKYDLSGLSSKAFDVYKSEMYSIWENILPGYLKNVCKVNEELVEENRKLKLIMRYKLVKIAIRLNDFYQKLKV